MFRIETTDEEIIEAKFVINAAGLYADTIHNLICKESFKITPRSGEYYVMDKSQGKVVKCTIFQCPSKLGKGILVTPTVYGNLLVGPDARDIEDKDELGTISEGLNVIREASMRTTKKMNFRESIRNFAGLRAVLDTDDFIVEENDEVKGFIDVAGCKLEKKNYIDGVKRRCRPGMGRCQGGFCGLRVQEKVGSYILLGKTK